MADPVLEAMAAGLPVLATPVGGLTEIVADGVTGWFIDGTGARRVEAALERLVEIGTLSASCASRASPASGPWRCRTRNASSTDTGRCSASSHHAGRRRAARSPSHW